VVFSVQVFRVKFLNRFSFPTSMLQVMPRLIDLYLLALIIFGEEKLLSSSLCSCILPHVSSSLMGSNILLCIPFSNTLRVFFAQGERTSFTLIRKSRENTLNFH
jgi:hypothetical protein